jgi:Domain of unknown function (DUF4280)
MGQQVCMGALCQCSFGLAPSSMVVLPANKTMACSMPAANIMDNKPMVNIMPFVMCTSMANPEVIAETGAALGVPTPAPCIPNTVAPWAPGSATVMIANMPALNGDSKLECLWGGTIQIVMPGQMTVMVP